MARFIAVNGIRTNGVDNIDRLTEELRALGHEVIDLGLPVIGAFAAASRKTQMTNGRMVADAALRAFPDGRGINVIAHSNGVPSTYRSMWQPTIQFDTLFLFNGAMRAGYPWPTEGFTRAFNIYNPHDKALKWGSRARWIRREHIFGDFGRTGYDGPRDRRIENVQNPFREGKNFHNPWHSRQEARRWAEQIGRWLKESERPYAVCDSRLPA